MSRLVDILIASEAGWTWLYTAGMPEEAAERRREEIASAGWEYLAWAQKNAVWWGRAIFDVAWQFVAGVPADIAWRMQAPPVSRKRLDEAAVAALLILGVAVGIPLALLCLSAGPGIARNDDTVEATLVCAFAVLVILVFGFGSALTLDRWPAASAALGLLGSFCLVCSFAWWLPELAVVAAGGGVAALVAGWKAHESVR